MLESCGVGGWGVTAVSMIPISYDRNVDIG